MTEDEISKYVVKVGGVFSDAEAYALANPSSVVECARECLAIAERTPKPKGTRSYWMWLQTIDRAQRNYSEAVFFHYWHGKIERPAIDTTTPACEDG